MKIASVCGIEKVYFGPIFIRQIDRKGKIIEGIDDLRDEVYSSQYDDRTQCHGIPPLVNFCFNSKLHLLVQCILYGKHTNDWI